MAAAKQTMDSCPSTFSQRLAVEFHRGPTEAHLDALRVFDVFSVFFGNRLGAQSMAIYAQSTIVGDGHVGYGAAVSTAIFLIIAVFVVIYVTFMRVTEE